jgi:nitrogen fixation NifU-like protein
MWSRFSDKVKDYFNNPRNMGEITRPDGVGHVGDTSRGIDVELYIKVEDKIITDAKFKAFGCVTTIATSSMISQLLKGKSIEQALELSEDEIVQALNGLPPDKMFCVKIGRELIKSAIDDFRDQKKRESQS